MSWRDRLGEVWGRLRAIVAPVWDWIREEPLAGIAISVALHVVIIALVIHFGRPGSAYTVKRGEPMFVELPDVKEQAPRGNPGPPAAPAPPPSAKSAPKPPAPRVQPPAPKAEAKARPAEPQRGASARQPEAPRERPAPAPERSAAKPAEPPPPDPKSAMPVPVQPPRAAAAPTTPTTPAPATPPAAAAQPSGPSGSPSAPSRGGPAGPQVASVPPGPKEPVFDLKSLGRGGGAGGRGEGRGGIEGEPIPLDSPDPKYSDYLDRIRRMIKERWGYPCIKSGTGCDYKTAELVIEFGIAKDGHVPFISLVHTSGFTIYDDYALNAIRLASPFPPVPDALSKKGFPILARFRYVVDTSLVNTLR